MYRKRVIYETLAHKSELTTLIGNGPLIPRIGRIPKVRRYPNSDILLRLERISRYNLILWERSVTDPSLQYQ